MKGSGSKPATLTVSIELHSAFIPFSSYLAPAIDNPLEIQKQNFLHIAVCK